MAKPKKKPADEFDVDAAMASEGIALDGFDVDAAMKAEGIAAPKSNFSKVSARSSSTADPDQLGPYDAFAKFIGQPGRSGQPPTTMAKGLSAASFLGLPFGVQPKNPEQASTIYNNFTDVMTLGLGDRIRDSSTMQRIGDRVGDFFGLDNPEDASPDERARLDRENPREATLGKAAGVGASVMAGPAKVLDAGARAVVTRAAPAAARSVAGRVAGSAAAGGLSGAAGGAVEGAFDGGKEGAATGAKYGGLVGALFGAGGSLVGEGIGAGADYLRGLPWISKYLKHKGTGDLARAEAETASGALPEGREGIQKASERARDEIFARDEAMTSEAQGRLAAARAPELGRPVDTLPIERGLQHARDSSLPASSTRSPDAIHQQATRILDDLQLDPTVEDALHVRAGLDEASAFGSPSPTDAQLTARKLRAAVRSGVREASPATAAADDEFTAFKRAQHRRGDILTGREEGARLADAPQPTDDALEAAEAMPLTRRVADEKAAAQRLRRIGDQSVEGLAGDEYLQELASQDPAFARSLARLEAKKSFEATRFALRPAIQDNLDASVASVPGLGAGTMRLLGQNFNALGARVLEPAAGALERMPRLALPGLAGQETPDQERRLR